MNFLKRYGLVFFLILGSMPVLAGCQTIRNDNALSKEKMLAAAGFQMKQAQTPEQLADVQRLPQHKLVSHTREGHVFYVYADASACQCIYVGTESNYQEYQKMSYEQNLADEQEMTAELNSETALNWGAWGPWGPWIF